MIWPLAGFLILCLLHPVFGLQQYQLQFALAALGHALDNALVLDVVGVVGLDVGGKTIEGALDRFLGGGVHHARLQKDTAC